MLKTLHPEGSLLFWKWGSAIGTEPVFPGPRRLSATPGGSLDSVPLGGLLLLASSSGSLTSTHLSRPPACCRRYRLRRRPGQVTLPVWFDPPSPVG